MAVAQNRPNKLADGIGGGAPSRSGNYSEAYVLPISGKELFAADEGSYFMAVTPTPGTGVIGHAAPTTFDETKPYLVCYNGGQGRIYPQFLRLHETVVSTAAARVQFTVVLDTGNRLSSAGTALTKSNVNMDSSVSSAAVITVGAAVATAATANRRIIDHVVFRGTIDVVEDVYELVFGGQGQGSSNASRAATVMDATRMLPPVVIGPGQSLLIHQWAASQSAGPTFQVAFGYIER